MCSNNRQKVGDILCKPDAAVAPVLATNYGKTFRNKMKMSLAHKNKRYERNGYFPQQSEHVEMLFYAATFISGQVV
jgi:hypothetical protein